MKITDASGSLPRQLFVKSAMRIGRNPVSGGGFVDVWKGNLEGEEVALKVLRVFAGDVANEEIRQVSFSNPKLSPF